MKNSRDRKLLPFPAISKICRGFLLVTATFSKLRSSFEKVVLHSREKLTIISAVTTVKGTLFYLDKRRIRFTYFSFISVDISLPSPLNPSAFKSF